MQRHSSNRHQVAQMLTRGKFGHNASVFGVQPDLRRDDVRQYSAPMDDGRTGLVTGGFDGKERHLERET